MMNRDDILKEVENIVCNDRQNEHGKPEDTFKRISILWSAYISQDLGQKIKVTPRDVAIMMALLKIARISGNVGHKDSWLDAIGYLTCGAEFSLNKGE